MPAIAWFYSISIQMFFNDHEPPHFHARYGRAKGLVRISDGKLFAGIHRRLEKIAGPGGKG